MRYLLIISITLLLSCLISTTAFSSNRFIDNGDGTIIDSQLKLMWSKTDNQADITFADADKWIQYAFGYTISTQYDNWRLPLDTELQRLFNEGKPSGKTSTDCGMPASIIPGIGLSCSWIWATDSVTGKPVLFNFNYGTKFGSQAGDHEGCRALPVREVE